MRIGIEFIDLIPDRVGGVERYVAHLVCELATLNSGHEFRLFLRDEARPRFLPGGPVSVHSADGGFPKALRRLGPLRSLWQWIEIHRELGRWKHDVFHGTMHFPRPAWGAKNFVLTIHDLLYKHHPETFGTFGARTMGWHCRAGARRARRIIADSQFVKTDIVETYRVAAEKIDVVYLGVDRTTFHPQPDRERLDRFRRQRRLPADYLFFPAATFVHKNHRGLFQALAALRDRHRLACPLVLTGNRRRGFPAVQRAMHECGVASDVVWLDYLDTEELVLCYQGAAALAFPSLHEGFGLPVIEGMACGCPVACSRTTATGEVAGDAALIFDPANIDEMAHSLHAVLTDSGERDRLRQRGLERAAEFHWQRTARETLEVYEAVAG